MFPRVGFLLFQNYVTAPDVGGKSSTGCQSLSDKDNTEVQQSLLSAVTSFLPSSLDAPHGWQQGSFAFVQFSSLKSHMASSHSHRKKTVDSLRGDGDAVNHSDSNHEVNTKSASICVMTLYVEWPLLQSVA